MRVVRMIAMAILILSAAFSVAANLLAPYDYAAQFRDHANEPPSRRFPLGTDELGRDRLSRLLEGTRVSLLCAPTAALIATALAGVVGLAGGYFGGWVDTIASALTDLFLSLPWLFALLTFRALLPLNIPIGVSVSATFLLLAAVGWAPGARVVRACVADMRRSGPLLHARAYGCQGTRMLCAHVLPNLKPVLSAQFWILVPVFLLTEANLGVLGLGVPDPLPSLGNMLAELQNYQRIPEAPWVVAPAVLLVLIVASLHFVISGRQTWE